MTEFRYFRFVGDLTTFHNLDPMNSLIRAEEVYRGTVSPLPVATVDLYSNSEAALFVRAPMSQLEEVTESDWETQQS